MEAGFHPTQVVEVETKYLRELKARRAEHYLRGPIQIGDIHAAAKMAGRASLCCWPYIIAERSQAATP
jgi:hypothetical protein